MTKKKNHEADIVNKNKGTKGTNITLDKAMGHRGKQIAQAKKEKEIIKLTPKKPITKNGK